MRVEDAGATAPSALKTAVAIETQQRCLGSCTGCVLTEETRRSVGGDLPEHLDTACREVVRSFVGAFAERAEAAYGGDVPPDLAAVHFLQGDHMLLPDAELERMVRMVREATGGRALALFSSSLIGKPAVMRRKLSALREAAGRLGQGTSLLLVFDPKRVADDRFEAIYGENLRHAMSEFPVDEPILNVGPDVAASVPPAHIDAFLERNGFRNVEISLFPVRARAPLYARTWRETVAWIAAVVAASRRGGAYTVRLAHMIEATRRETDGVGVDGWHAHLASKLGRSVYVDGDGYASHAHPGGIADVTPLARRFGFDGLPHVSSGEVTAEAWMASAGRAAARIVSEYTRDRRCAACPHQRACAGCGFTLIRTSMAGQDIAADGCPIGVRPIFEAVS